MIWNRQARAERALEGAFTAFNAGDKERCGDELTRLFDVTSGSEDHTLIELRGRGEVLAGAFWMRSGNTASALAAFGSACDVVLVLPAEADATGLANLVGALSNELYRFLTRGDGHSRADAGAVFEPLLTAFIDRLAPQGGGVGSPLLDRLDRLLPPAAEPARLLVAWLAHSCGIVATDQQRSSDALRFQIHSARMVEGLQRCAEECLSLAAMVFPAMEFERKRFGDIAGSERALERSIGLMAKLGASAEMLDEMRDIWQARFDVDAAMEAGDWRAARDAADAMAQRAGPGVMADVAEALAAQAAGDREKALQLMENAGGPGRHMSQLIRAADRPPGDGQAIATLASLVLMPDLQIAWRAAIHLGVALEVPPARWPFLAILFGKMGMRALERLRHDLAKQRFAQMDPFHDELTIRAAKHLREQLVRCGRLGEALRQSDLIDTRQSLLPPPELVDVQALVEASCPLTAAESRAVERLRAVCGEGAAPVSDAWIDQLEATLTVPTSGRGHVMVEGDDPLPADAMLLSIGPAGDCYKATLTGLFGTRSEVVRMPPDRLGAIAFDALSALARPQADPLPALQVLHEVLLAPFWSVIRHGRVRVLVVHAGGALRRLPFGVLHDGSHYLLEHLAVVTHPGVMPLRLGRGINRPLRAASAAVSKTPSMTDLPSASLDADVLEKVIVDGRVGSVDIAKDGDVNAARLESMLRRRPSVVHLSCHFVANHADAGRSAFLLGDGSPFTLTRLAQLDFSSVDLALLMGCGTRSVSETDGTLGIQAVDSLLLSMGVGAVLSSAWRVDDRTAHEVLRRFVHGVFSDDWDLAGALREAVLAVAANPLTGILSHPHAWGGLLLTGDWTGLRSEVA